MSLSPNKLLSVTFHTDKYALYLSVCFFKEEFSFSYRYQYLR